MIQGDDTQGFGTGDAKTSWQPLAMKLGALKRASGYLLAMLHAASTTQGSADGTTTGMWEGAAGCGWRVRGLLVSTVFTP